MTRKSENIVESAKSKEVFRLGELFCGPGGIGLGAKKAKCGYKGKDYSITHAWATDFDKDSCETFQKNLRLSKDTVVCKDIRKLEFEKLFEISEIDALAFGFPCNDFSSVGEKKGINGKFGPLYQNCVKALAYFKPMWFLAENVSGLKNANEGEALSIILKELSEVGYSVFPHLYRFEQYGVPQTRHRIIIIGIRNDFDLIFKIPSSKRYVGLEITCRSAIENPPIGEKAFNNEFTKQSESVIERLKFIKPGENVFTADLPSHLKLNIKSATISHIYKRLDPNKPAYTITGSGGGGTHVYHWVENRALTNRERARLQTFPDDYFFFGSKESVRKQIGMAVPPRVSEIIFKAVLKTFAGISYPSITANMDPIILK